MNELKPPLAKKSDHQLEKHGDIRIDPYYWMRERENPDVIAWLSVENANTKSALAHTEDLQKTLFDEIVGRIKQTDMSVPYKDNGYFYLTRYEAGKEHPIYVRKKENLQNDEEIMLNVNDLATGYDYYHVVGQSVSPNNEMLAFGEDTLSRRIYTLRFKDLENDQMLNEQIPNTTGTCVWANDNKTVFYGRKDETLRAYKILKHIIGTDPATDVEIYHEKDDTYIVNVTKTKSKKFIVIGSYATLANEYRILAADNPNGDFRLFNPREHKHEHFIDHVEDHFYIRTNWDATNFRLMRCPEENTGQSHWKEVVAHRPDILLQDMEFFKHYWVLSERVKGLTQLHVLSLLGQSHYINFDQKAFYTYTSINRDYDTDTVRIGFTSLTTPVSTYDYNMQTQTLDLLKQEEVVGNFSPDDYISERIFAPARDGVSVPISIVYRKGFVKNGTQPLLLYGYGSYGISIDPTFSSVRLSLLDRGFAFAIAHIRGGQEMGRQWYEDGKFLKKKNTFTDFIDCGRYLIEQEYCDKKSLYAMGGSAGGLLLSAVMNMAPDLFRGIIAAVPFVDVLTTMLDESIPLTTGEYDEWGNPNDKTFYDYMKSYSPYDNVEPKDYPALLVTTGLHDSQVQYWEPAKWVAKLRELKTDTNPLLLYTNMDTGHSGASGRFERHKETAMEYAFFLDLAGKTALID